MDDSAIAVLKEAFRAANSEAEWATLAVVIGLIIEFAVLLIFAKEISRTEKWLLVFANILVAGGVGGEYVFGGRATNAAIQLQQASDEKVATLSKEAAQAKKGAAEAMQRAADAQLALERFKAPRTIDKLLHDPSVIGTLGRFAKTPFDIGVNPGHEPQKLMGQIISMLKAAGWQLVDASDLHGLAIVIDHKSARLMTGFEGLAVEIDQSKASEWEPALLALATVLRTAIPDTKANIATDGSAAPNAIHIYVGTK